MNKTLKLTVAIGALMGILTLSGCAAIGTEVAHRNLEAQTEMSHTIFLTPVTKHDRSIYLQAENTTGKPSFSIKSRLASDLHLKGYTIYNKPKDLRKAYYLLQTNLLRVGRISETAAKEMMGFGYGGTLAGAAAGANIGAAATESIGGSVAGGLIGGVADTIADNMVKDVTYSGIVDVKITVQSTNKSYRTRIATSANKVNLHFKEAEPKLENELASSISGLFT